jgi:hypothetical protein
MESKFKIEKVQQFDPTKARNVEMELPVYYHYDNNGGILIKCRFHPSGVWLNDQIVYKKEFREILDHLEELYKNCGNYKHSMRR